MKANKIYLLKFSVRPIEIDNDDSFEHPFYNDLSLSLNDEDRKYVGFADNEDMFIRLLDHKLDMVCNILTNYGFVFEKKDVTIDAIRGRLQKDYPEVSELTPYLFEDFRYDNTSIDDVLDKINETGMKSLDKIDNEILKNA